jgi:hypothetical protein
MSGIDIPNTVDRAHIIVPASAREAANDFAAQVDPDTGGPYTFDVALVPDDEPADSDATHYGCSTRLTANGVSQVKFLKSEMPSAVVYWQSEGWTWASVLSNESLQRRKEP